MKDKDEDRNELVPVPEYEIIDQVDDKAIVDMMTGQAIEDYVYSFRQGGRQVEGLTLAGINEAANRRGGIQVDDIKFEEREHSWLAIVKAVDTFTGSARYGASEQPKKVGGKDDPFAFTKAIHKAQRNAIKQLLPTPVIKEVLRFYLSKRRGVDLPQHQQSQQTALPVGQASTAGQIQAAQTAQTTQVQTPVSQPSTQPSAQIEDSPDKITNAQKSAFALANKLKDRMTIEGLSQSDYWNYVRRKFHVESRNDMTEEQWTQLTAELKAAEDNAILFKQLTDQIKKLEAAQRSSEIPSEQSETEETEEKTERLEEKVEVKSETREEKDKTLKPAKIKETLF